MSSAKNNVVKLESAKLRALRAKKVLTCQRALRAYVLTCQHALRADVLTRQSALRPLMVTCQLSLSAYVPHVSTCSACSCTHVPTWLASLRATCYHALSLLPHTACVTM